MPLILHAGSGSPYVWRVWLALEHKGVPYDVTWHSFSGGDLRTPGFRALNPRGRVPVLQDGDFALTESLAILQYLDAVHPERPLFPQEPRARARCTRLILEADHYLGPANRVMLQLVLYRKPDDVEDEELTRAVDALVAEYAHFENALTGPYFGGDAPDAADFALYPFLAFVERFELRKPDLGLPDRLGEPLQNWMARMRALPLVEKTRPPHWKA